MTNKQVPFSRIAQMPTIHLFASPACNLECPYCSQIDGRTSLSFQDILFDQDFIERVSRWQPTHFYVSGGEPFIHKGLFSFLQIAYKAGHIISFDTNGVVPLPELKKIITSFPASFWGFFNISHHYTSISIY